MPFLCDRKLKLTLLYVSTPKFQHLRRSQGVVSVLTGSIGTLLTDVYFSVDPEREFVGLRGTDGNTSCWLRKHYKRSTAYFGQCRFYLALAVRTKSNGAREGVVRN